MEDLKIIDGKKLALQIEEGIKLTLQSLPNKPKAITLCIGSDPNSKMYTQMKLKKAQELGIDLQALYLPEDVKYNEVAEKIEELNKDLKVSGIMVQLPIPEFVLEGHEGRELLELIDPKKDIDGLTGKSNFIPATVKGILRILDFEEVLGEEKKIVVVGGVHGTVGTSMVSFLGQLDENVTGVSGKDENLGEKTLDADVLVSATGIKNLITKDMVKKGVIVIDVSGDIDFENVKEVAGRITPPKGGVGPMTIVSLMENIIEATTLSSRTKGERS